MACKGQALSSQDVDMAALETASIVNWGDLAKDRLSVDDKQTLEYFGGNDLKSIKSMLSLVDQAIQ